MIGVLRTAASFVFPLLTVLVSVLWGMLPAVLVALAGAAILHLWLHAAVARALQHQLEAGPAAPRGSPVPGSLRPAWSDPIQPVADLARIGGELAQWATYERVRGNLRMLSLTELWRAVQNEDPEQTLFEGIREFCQREVGVMEVALLRLDARAQEISGNWAQPGTDQNVRAHTVRWATSSIEGSVARALRSAQTVAGLEGSTEELLRVNGERPRIAAYDRLHAVVPLLSPAPPSECLDGGWLYQEGCPAHKPHPDALARARTREPGRGLDLGTCGTCTHFPVHGVLIAVGAEGSPAFTAAELSLLETVGSIAASVLEHAALYRDIKGAERFREQVLDALIDGLVSTDQHGRVVYANQRARELLAAEDLHGRRLDEWVVLPGGSSALTRTLMEGKSYLQADGTALVRDDQGNTRRVPVRLNLTPFRPEVGGVNGAVCVMEDRTTVRAMEQEIRHLDTLAAIGRFASSLAHEVRNPLGGIQAGIEYLARALSREERMDMDTQENLEVIQGEIERLDGILENLLSVARPREIVLTECEPDALVRRAARAIAPLADSLGIELRVRIASGLAPIHADAEMIHQVLFNLLKNAIEASRAQSPVDLVVQARIDPAGEESFDGITIEVLDRGNGISVEDLTRIFEPFYSRKAKGTGLGLYVCHGFVQRHDGRLWAENRRGGGARFVLELPHVPALMGGLHETSCAHRR